MVKRGDESGTVAVVLSGAAARGAFQAGALAELLPALERDGIRPQILLGTSAGAINAALWAAKCHLGADRAAEDLCELWREMSHTNVFESLLPGSVGAGIDFLAGAVLNRGRGTTSLLDTAPLHDTAVEKLDIGQIAENITSGHPTKLGVIATRVPPADADSPEGTASGRSVLFLHEKEVSDYPGKPERALDVVRCPSAVEQVLASAAIPMAFPAQRVSEPPDAAGWYVDGGVRLNAPLGPAVELGATRIIVISATSTVYGLPLPPDDCLEPPDLADSGAQALHAVLADRMVEDLLALQRTNRMIHQLARDSPSSVLLRKDGKTPYASVEFLTVSPPPGEMGRLAAKVYEQKIAGAGALREPDNWLLGRMLRGAGDASGRRELLSYLLFDEDYFALCIELGREQAARHVSATREWNT